MLNPEFKLLDPEMEQLTRLQEFSPINGGQSILMAMTNQQINQNQQLLKSKTDFKGIISQKALLTALDNEFSQPNNQLSLWGWPKELIDPLLDKIKEPAVIQLGLLTGDGIEAGAVVGVSKGGLDFVTTYQWIWQDEPELVTQQTIDGFDQFCQIIEKRFKRQALGLFIYMDEFKQWRDGNYSIETLQGFCQQRTAIYKWL